jgi:hypothetical protein
MKGLIAAFLLMSNFCFAQMNGPLLEGFMPRDCYIYTLELFTKKDTALLKLSTDLIKPGTKTIYVLKTIHVDDLPAEINGYAIKRLDADSNKKLLYTEQIENDAVILYFDKMHRYADQMSIAVLPVRMTKKRKKRKVEFELRGYTVYFYFDRPINRFRFDRTQYFDYTLLDKKKD